MVSVTEGGNEGGGGSSTDYNGDGVTDSTVLVQFELANGILERNVSVRVATVSSNASTGIK